MFRLRQPKISRVPSASSWAADHKPASGQLENTAVALQPRLLPMAKECDITARWWLPLIRQSYPYRQSVRF